MKLGWFHRGDIDGFFGLFVDNLLQLMLIMVLCTMVAGLPAEMVLGTVLPGAAFSILAGNLFYAWQAKRLAETHHRPHTTALPYGINTVSLFAHVFLIMGPVYRASGSADLAWRAGLFACLGSAVIEIVGAFFGSWLRRHTPRAALLTALAGIALTFISMGFVFQIFANPVLALAPAFFILFAYGSGARLPLSLPGGFVAVLLGTCLAWGLRAAGVVLFTPDQTPYSFALHLPSSSLGPLWEFLSREEGWRYFSVIFPMGLFNVIGSLQNLESAEAAGDKFDTRSSLLANGLGGLLACFLGSPFPTTIYIGHPGWKAMGARWGYSVLNGVAITALCLTGAVTLVLKVVPMEAMIGILLWIGLIIAAQAYKDVPRHHFLGVAFGFIPTLAGWLLLQLEGALRVAGSSLYQAAPRFGSDLYIHGVIALNQGFIITSMIFAAVMVYVAEQRFLVAAAWCLAAAALSFFGVIHGYSLEEAGVMNKFGLFAAPGFSLAYLLCAGMLFWLHLQAGSGQDHATHGDGISGDDWARAFNSGERRQQPRPEPAPPSPRRRARPRSKKA